MTTILYKDVYDLIMDYKYHFELLDHKKKFKKTLKKIRRSRIKLYEEKIMQHVVYTNREKKQFVEYYYKGQYFICRNVEDSKY